MRVPTRITFRHMTPSTGLSRHVLDRLDWIEDRAYRALKCGVTIEAPAGSHRSNAEYEVRMVLAVPGSEIVVHEQDVDPYAAVRNATSSLRKKLGQFLGRKRATRLADSSA